MKLISYNENSQICLLVEKVKKPVVEDNNVTWEGGALSGVNLPFIILDDAVAVDTQVTDAIIALDKKAEFLKVDLVKENEELRQQLAQTNADLMGLTDYVFGGGA